MSGKTIWTLKSLSDEKYYFFRGKCLEMSEETSGLDLCESCIIHLAVPCRKIRAPEEISAGSSLLAIFSVIQSICFSLLQIPGSFKACAPEIYLAFPSLCTELISRWQHERQYLRKRKIVIHRFLLGRCRINKKSITYIVDQFRQNNISST